MKSPDDKTVKSVFLNNIDSYHGKNISKNFGNTVIGSTLLEQDEDNEEIMSEGSDGVVNASKEGCWNTIGTIKCEDENKKKVLEKEMTWVKTILNKKTREELYEYIIECDVIIYDISIDSSEIDEAMWVLSELSSDIERFEKAKIFILLSNVMTWAKTKPLDPEDVEMAFTEEDYRRRKAHPNFRENITAEKNTIKIGKTIKSKLYAYVVNAGMCYGEEEQLFHYLFKSAWSNEEYVEIYGSGENVIPTIHIKDLSSVLINICDMKPKNKYIVAVDESNVTLEEIVRTVSKNLGNGSVKKINKEEALLMKSLKQADYDQLLINCRIDASYINENMQIRWHCDTGIVENIEKVVKEYRNSRDLLPIRVYINGPPSSGKTSITEKLCEHYKIHHIKIKDVILETIDNLKLSAARLEKVDNDEDPDQDTRAQEDSDLLESALANMDDNNGRLDDSFVIQFLKRKLKSAPCQNQGFILDGYPKIISQSKSLFEPDDSDVEEEQGRKGNISYDESIMAQHIFCLESQDNFLRERIMNLPETVVAGSHNTEAGFTRRLLQYKQTNTDEDTIFNYFDEIELHASTFDVSKDESINNQLTIDKMIKIIGKCKNYGLTLEELEKLRLEEMDKLRIQKAEQEAEMERIEFDENEKRAKNQKEWAKLLKDVRREEYELLEQRSLPLRNYLMENVMPTLLQAMRACSEVRPDDPIDYVAEYLFQNNPEAD